MSIRRTMCGASFLALTLLSQGGLADAPTVLVEHALGGLPDGGARFLQAASGSTTPSIIARVESRTEAKNAGLIPITDHLAVGRRKIDTWGALSGASGLNALLLSPTRDLLLDNAGLSLRLGEARDETGLSGEGTIVGVVDTGADAAHPAFLDADGKSRIAWFLSFGEEPRGLHPEMEEEYGCTGEEPCAVLSGADIDDIIDSRILANLPKDPIGHGTHITSLAAGAGDDYPGIAPGADLVIVAASDADGAVSDARILLGTRFVFDRATETNQPAVVNISLGSSFGAHDGSSAVEEGLAELGSGPGRAVIIAAGNSGSVHEDLFSDYPGPFGVHTEVAVLPGSEVRVPVITPPLGETTHLEGSLFAWISTQPGDELSVGFGNGDKSETDAIEPNMAGGLNSEDLDDDDDYDVVILNGVDDELETEVPPGNVVVAVIGNWKAGRVFELILKGDATARMWLTGKGDVSPFVNGLGPLFPRARVAGTVAVPGSHPDIITVGATVNRTSWIDYAGGIIEYASSMGQRSSFSASGPNLLGTIKPDLVAPGGGVIGAMAREADPRTSLTALSQFASLGACLGGVECFVIDDDHGVASGTSMSAPLVSGAVALMMQRDPELTMEDAKRHLMAGTQAVKWEQLGSRVGAGRLDVVGALIAQERDLSSLIDEASAEHCRVVWSNDFVHPAPGPDLEGLVLLRDEDDSPTRVDPEDVSVEVRGPGRVEQEHLSAGLIRLRVGADANSSSKELTIVTRINGSPVAEDTFVIERDPALAEHGFEVTGGTCSATPKPRPSGIWLAFFLGAFALAIGRRQVRR